MSEVLCVLVYDMLVDGILIWPCVHTACNMPICSHHYILYLNAYLSITLITLAMCLYGE